MLEAVRSVTRCLRVRMREARTSKEEGWISRELRSYAWIS